MGFGAVGVEEVVLAHPGCSVRMNRMRRTPLGHVLAPQEVLHCLWGWTGRRIQSPQRAVDLTSPLRAEKPNIFLITTASENPPGVLLLGVGQQKALLFLGMSWVGFLEGTRALRFQRRAASIPGRQAGGRGEFLEASALLRGGLRRMPRGREASL